MYIQEEGLGSIGQDRVISVLTMENLGGGFVGGVAMRYLGILLLGEGWPLFSVPSLVQSAAILVGLAIGILMTVKWSGQSVLDSALLVVGFHMRKLTGETTIHPHAPVSSGQRQAATTIYRDGR